MTYITCDHPSDKIEIKKEIIPTTDILVKHERPQPYCTKCETYLHPEDKLTIRIINYWFVKQDGRVKAMATA